MYPALSRVIRTGEIGYPIKSNPIICYNCGKSVNLCFDGKRIYNEDTESTCFDKKEFSFDITVNSGKLVLADWIPYGLEILGIEDEDVNFLEGRYIQSKNYADLNVMHFYVGNTSPLVSQKDNTVIIESPGYYENEDGTDGQIFYDESFEQKGNICTDLWWATGIDLEYYKSLINKKFGEGWTDEYLDNFLKRAIILDVEPGIYTCTTFYENCDRYDYSKSNLFIRIEKKN